MFVATCARCHGEDGTGNPPRPALIGVAAEEPDRAVHIELVTNGGRFMPSFAEDLTAEEIEAVVDYVRETFVETP